jgi:uncharacterized protein (DUF1499 family)
MKLAWYAPTIAIGVLAVAGPLAAWLGLVPPVSGFLIFSTAILVSVISLPALAGAAAFASATGRDWRGQAVRAAVVPLLVVVAVVLPRLGDVAPLHDVTTDPEDAPSFAPSAPERTEEASRERILALQRDVHPDVAPLVVPLPPDRALELAEQVARDQSRWEDVMADPASGVVWAVAVSGIFGFRDDVVIRVRPAEGGDSRIDMRSRSRVGESDLGANAARIEQYLGALAERAGGPAPS